MVETIAPWVIVVTSSSSEELAATSLRRAAYRVYLPRRKVRLATTKPQFGLRPLWPGYLLIHDWRGWPEQQIEGRPRLLKSGGNTVEMSAADVAVIMAEELSGGFDDPLPQTGPQRRTDLAIGDTVEFDRFGERVLAVLDRLSDNGQAVVRTLMFKRETLHTVPAETLRAICA